MDETSPDAVRRAALPAMLAALLMILLQVAGKATRDALFLSNHPAAELPKAMAGAAIISLLTALIMGKLLQRFGPGRSIPALYVLNALGFGVDLFMAQRSPAAAAWVVYLHLAAVGPVLVSGFWSVVNERFDPHTARQVVGKIAASAALGGVLGGVLAQQVAAAYSLALVLPSLAAISVVAALVIQRLAAGKQSLEVAAAPSEGRAGNMAESGYLRQIAGLVLLTSVAAGTLDFALKAEVVNHYPGQGELTSFFAIFHAALGVLVFLVQTLFSSRALRKLGLGGTIALLPAAVVVGGVLSASLVKLWAVTLTRGLEAALRSSLFRSGYELLYTPVAPAQKRAAKTFIDVGFDRLGDIAAAGIVTATLMVFPDASTRVVLISALLVALASLLLCTGLNRGYVTELTASLRSGVLSADDVPSFDATTQRTLTDTTMAMDREHLLREIEALQAKKSAQGDAADPNQPDPSRVESISEERMVRIMERAAQLSAGEPATLRELLSAKDLEWQLMPFIVPLLGVDDLARQAMTALRRVGREHTGLLLDSLLAGESSIAVRRRLPRVLEQFATPRVRDGLLMALCDEPFELRQQVALSLLRIVDREPELKPSARAIFDAVLLETGVSQERWQAPAGGKSDSLSPNPLGLPPRLQHVFTLLSTVLDREPLELCLGAFAGDNDVLQGTALEYLENVLPAAVYSSLLKQLKPKTIPQRTQPRAKERIVEELNQSVSSLVIDRESLLQGRRKAPST